MKIKTIKIDYEKAGQKKADKVFGQASIGGKWIQVHIWVTPEEALKQARVRTAKVRVLELERIDRARMEKRTLPRYEDI